MKIELSSVLLGCLVSFTDHEDFSSVLLCVVLLFNISAKYTTYLSIPLLLEMWLVPGFGYCRQLQTVYTGLQCTYGCVSVGCGITES